MSTKLSAARVNRWRELLLKNFCNGAIHWDKSTSELGFCGMRYSIKLDYQGCPEFSQLVLNRLEAAELRETEKKSG